MKGQLKKMEEEKLYHKGELQEAHDKVYQVEIEKNKEINQLKTKLEQNEVKMRLE